MIKLDFSKYKGVTLLKEWWGVVQEHIKTLMDAINDEETARSNADNGTTVITPNLGDATKYRGIRIKDGLQFLTNVSATVPNGSVCEVPDVQVEDIYLGEEMHLPSNLYSGYTTLTSVAAAVKQNNSELEEETTARENADNEINAAMKNLTKDVQDILASNKVPYRNRKHYIYRTGMPAVSWKNEQGGYSSISGLSEGDIVEVSVSEDCESITALVGLYVGYETYTTSIKFEHNMKVKHKYLFIVTKAPEKDVTGEARLMFDNGVFQDYVLGANFIDTQALEEEIEKLRQVLNTTLGSMSDLLDNVNGA